MKKLFHRIFKDKHIDSNKDENLSGAIEQYRFLLKELSRLSTDILKRKLNYFIKYRKLHLLKYVLIIGVFCTIIGLVSNYLFKVNLLKPKVYFELIIYIPDSIDQKVYKSKLCYSNIKFITIYTESPTKTYDEFKTKLGAIESGNDYKKCREGSQYWGKYQFGSTALNAIGLSKINKETFLNTPELQEAALLLLLKFNKLCLLDYINKYNNKIVRGYHLTESGLLAMAHNVGCGEVKRFLDSECSYVPLDGNGPSTKFLILGNYDLKLK